MKKGDFAAEDHRVMFKFCKKWEVLQKVEVKNLMQVASTAALGGLAAGASAADAKTPKFLKFRPNP